MRNVIALLILCLMLLSLCACSQEQLLPTTTAALQPTSTTRQPSCIHVYSPADCENPKICTLCGDIRGSALGHEYAEGICVRCQAIDTSYVALTDGQWSTEALSDNGSQLELVELRFSTDGSALLTVSAYSRLSDVPEDQRTSAMLNEKNWYDYSGEIYYRIGSSRTDKVSYQADGNEITVSLISNDTTVGTLMLERTAGRSLTVTYFDGDFSAKHLQVGDVLIAQ